MKITFIEKLPEKAEKGDIFVSISKEKKDIFVRENGNLMLSLGVGEPKKTMTARKVPLLFRKMVQMSKAQNGKRLFIKLSDITFKHLKLSEAELGEMLVVNMLMADYQFTRYKSAPEEGWVFIEEVVLVGKENKNLVAGIEKGRLIGGMVNATRDIANMPGSDMTPTVLAEEAREAAKGTGVRVSVLDKKEMERLGMSAILAVAKGSDEEPKLIVLEYQGGKVKDKPTVLVGKGVTFDTGGVNVKTGDHMLGMNMDMSGGAAVIYSVVLAAKLKLKKNVIGIVPAVENAISGASYLPGDLIKSMSGKTIEVLNTDAEGRVILADALTYAKRYNPAVVIDVATLTGAALVALGERASAIFSRDSKLIEKLKQAGEGSGDFVWELPLWEEYESEVKGSFGDVTNTHNKNSRYGGAINGAVFLLQFAKDFPSWAHIDMAPRMEATSDESLEKGAVGSPVRLLIRYLEGR